MKEEKQRHIDLIRQLSSARAPSGFEDEAIVKLRELAPELGEFTEDSIRNLYLAREGNTGTKPMVMLDAHSDEVGFMVQSINPNGTISYLELGGVTANTLTGHRVWVRSSRGSYVPGVVTARPPHFSVGKAEAELTIDIGACSAEEAVERFHMAIGEPGVPAVDFLYDEENDLIFAKALDCRIGCAAQLAVLERLKGEALDVDVTGSFTAQEEVGDRGARVAASTVNPAAAIVFEGAPSDDTFLPSHAVQTGLKKGPMLRYMDRSMISNPRFTRYALDLAKSRGIPVQAAVRSGGGTNGGAIHTSNGSVPVIVISIPVRYIHSPNGIASYADFTAAVDLAAELVKSLNREVIAGF